jgi:hypothetical protein
MIFPNNESVNPNHISFNSNNKSVNLRSRKKFETNREKELNIEYKSSFNTFFSLLKNDDYVNRKKKEHLDYSQKIINNPYEEYLNLKNRMIIDNKKFIFIELEGLVIYLASELITNKVEDILRQNIALQYLREQLFIKIISILFESASYLPYMETIIVISDILQFFDIVQRIDNGNFSPYFHTRRYYFYQNYLLGLFPNEILFPSLYNIGATDLIKIRCIPIYFCGVSSEPLFVDEYDNTSLEFYFHDIQHSRRTHYYNNLYYDTFFKHNNKNSSTNPYKILSVDQFYLEMYNYTNKKILPLLKKTPNGNELNKLIKMIFFEIFHEKALPVLENVIYTSIFKKNPKTPVEKISECNIVSEKLPDVINDIYEDPPLLSNILYKLQSSFFNKSNNRKEFIVEVKYRKCKFLIEACIQILKKLNIKIDNTNLNKESNIKLIKKELVKLSCDKKFRPEAPKGYSINNNICNKNNKNINDENFNIRESNFF